MFMSDWKEEEDGSYWESVVSWNEHSQPIAVLRCVKDSDGNYEAIVREACTPGHMLASYPKRCTLDYAMYQAVALLGRMTPMDELKFTA